MLTRMALWITQGPSFAPKSGALGGIRTHDLCLRRAALYPLSYKRIFDRLGAEGGI